MITVGVRPATGPPVNGATRDRKALRCDDARTHGRQAACRAWVSAPFGAPARNPTRRPGRRLKTLPPRYRPTCPKSLASGRVSIAVSGAGCRPVCGRRPRRRSMKAAPCPDRVQTIDCHPCPSFGGGRKGGLENKVLAARKGGFTTRTHLIANARGLPVRAEMTGLRLQRLRYPG